MFLFQRSIKHDGAGLNSSYYLPLFVEFIDIGYILPYTALLQDLLYNTRVECKFFFYILTN